MTKKKLVVIGLGVVTVLTGLITCGIKKKDKINRIEEATSGLILTQESMLRFQEEKNEDFDERLDDLVDEVGSIYEHLEHVGVSKDEKQERR